MKNNNYTFSVMPCVERGAGCLYEYDGLMIEAIRTIRIIKTQGKNGRNKQIPN